MLVIDKCCDTFLKKYFWELRNTNSCALKYPKKGLFGILLIFEHSSCAKINVK